MSTITRRDHGMASSHGNPVCCLVDLQKKFAIQLHDERRGPSAINFVCVPTIAALPPGIDLNKLSVQNHLEAAAYYRLQLRNAIAIAEVRQEWMVTLSPKANTLPLAMFFMTSQLLNRVVIIPPLRCLCDRWWNNIAPDCKIPYSSLAGPFEPCPLDHLFFVGNLREAGVDFREWSFLVRVHGNVGITLELAARLELCICPAVNDCRATHECRKVSCPTLMCSLEVREVEAMHLAAKVRFQTMRIRWAQWSCKRWQRTGR